MAPKRESAALKKDSASRPVWVVLICGLPGSGKTTLRKRLVDNGWAYVSQDEMQTSDACEKALVKAMKSGKSCVVDRCNVTSSDRRLWMQHAQHAVEKGVVKGVDVKFEAVWMATPPQVCKERARARQGHETLSPEAAGDVIDSFCRGLRPPERSGQEPYQGVHVVASSEDVEVVVRRYKNPSYVDTTVCLDPPAKVLAAAAAVAAASVRAATAEGDDAEAGDGGALASGLAAPAAATANAAAELFILRHGERADKAKGNDGGWLDDPPLTKQGREMAKQAGVALAGLAMLSWAPAVYSSPYYRCLQTANEVAAELGLPLRVEPGLSEICVTRIFEAQPQMRPAEEALQGALTRAELDLSAAPQCAAPPVWPERGSQANQRVLQTARDLAARHPGQAVCLVCHAHSAIEISQHLPNVGGGATGARVPYCALSHIAPCGTLLRCLDQSYLREAAPRAEARVAEGPGAGEEQAAAAAGRWQEGWQWLSHGEVVQAPQAPAQAAEEQEDFIDALFDMALDDVLATFPTFKKLFEKGSRRKQREWREVWVARDIEVRQSLETARARGAFHQNGSAESKGGPSAGPD